MSIRKFLEVVTLLLLDYTGSKMEVTKLLVVAPNYNVVCCCTPTDNVLYTIDSEIEPPEITDNVHVYSWKILGDKFSLKCDV